MFYHCLLLCRSPLQILAKHRLLLSRFKIRKLFMRFLYLFQICLETSMGDERWSIPIANRRRKLSLSRNHRRGCRSSRNFDTEVGYFDIDQTHAKKAFFSGNRFWICRQFLRFVIVLILQNPFLHRRENHRQSNPEHLTPKLHIGLSGRANSAPGSYDWMLDRQLSVDSSLESVKEVSTDLSMDSQKSLDKTNEKRW